MGTRCRVGFIGASWRAIYAYANPLLRDFTESHQVVGIFDIRRRRIEVMNDYIQADIAGFTDVDALFKEARPDLVVISTPDGTHADYIEKAFAYDTDSITEKPLCINAEQAGRIRRAQQAKPHVTAVTGHNYRYEPHALQIKRIVDSGRLGDLRAAVFHECLDRKHGASYFRRWNRRMAASGGLLVHKASHCFDMLNWFVGSRPAQVIAQGNLTVYGPNASPFHGERCSLCQHATKCAHFIDISQDNNRSKLYHKSREPGSYTPDLCVYSPEIDIYDYSSVACTYENECQMTFDLCAYADYEGYFIALQGSKARLEHSHVTHRVPKADDPSETELLTKNVLQTIPYGRPPELMELDTETGGHGGADRRMIEDLFGSPDRSDVAASIEDGIQAVLLGAAANISIEEGHAVDVQALID